MHHFFSGGGGRQQNVDNKKFYKTLGIEQSASLGDIKKAYKTLAKKTHPDRGGDPEKFKEISKAYEVLADEEKRELYDKYGESAVTGNANRGGHHGGFGDLSDLFGFGGSSFGGGHHGHHRQRRKPKGQTVKFPLKIKLEDLYMGTKKKIIVKRHIICKTCKGKGGSKEDTCDSCHGRGTKISLRSLGPGMVQQVQSHCGDCNGKGTTIPVNHQCKKCKGQKTTKEKKTLEINITKGMLDGHQIRKEGASDEHPDIIAGDIVVQITRDEHPYFKREGPHLFYKKEITLLEALTGFEFTITHLDGRKLLVKSQPGRPIKVGDVKGILNEGMPKAQNPMINGTLFVEFKIIFPEKFEETQAKQLLTVFPKKNVEYKQIKLETMKEGQTEEDIENIDRKENEYDEEMILEEVDVEAEKKKYKETHHKSAYDDDDEEERHGGGGCQQV